MERVLARLREIERRLALIADQLSRLRNWLRDANQRIRELPNAGGAGAGGTQPNPDDIANAIHATAVVTTEITKSTGPGSPGVGAAKRYLDFAAGSDTTDVEEPIFSIWTDYAVAVDAVIQIEKKQGAWWLIDVDTCDHMI